MVAGNYIDECPELSCKPDGPGVRFPFRINGKHAHLCGYKGFEISCSSTNDSILQLPHNSANFSVTFIDYVSQVLYAQDPTVPSCHPKKLNTYNLSSSPFQFYPYSYNITLFNCSKETWKHNSKMYFPVSQKCLNVGGVPWDTGCPAGDQQYMVGALQSYSSSCLLLGMISCNKLYDVGDFDMIILSWSTPNCRSCEEEQGICMPNKNDSESETDCLNQTTFSLPPPSHTGGSNDDDGDREDNLLEQDSDAIFNLSTTQSLIVVFKPIKFAVLFVIGNLLAIGSTAFLIGPMQQLRMMFDATRIIATCVYFAFVVLALISALVIHSKVLTIVFIILEICALIWLVFLHSPFNSFCRSTARYSLSYIPFARRIVSNIMVRFCDTEL
ncbi:hypothetical protein ACFE04_011005 [Oxalis oulophora]